jgi:hypothetical protein
MLNLASFGPDDHQMLMQAGIEGLRDILALDLDAFRDRGPPGRHGAEAGRAAGPHDLRLVGAGADLSRTDARLVPRVRQPPAPAIAG